MNNTIPFHSATHAPQITVDVNILSMLKQAACICTMAQLPRTMAPIWPLLMRGLEPSQSVVVGSASVRPRFTASYRI